MNEAPIVRDLMAIPGARESGGKNTAKCPAHEDCVASLTWTVGDDGRVLIKCHAGCRAEDIVAALGHEMRDLFPPRDRQTRPLSKRTAYKACTADGTVVATHVRKDFSDGTKEVAWTKPDGTYGLDGTPVNSLPLFGTERSVGWPDTPIIVVEGEKAAQSLIDARVPALATFGAEHKPEPGPLEVLRGRSVILWPDNDEPGRRHMLDLAKRLAGIAAEVRWLEPPEDAPKGWDAADCLALAEDERKTLSELKQRIVPVPGVVTLAMYLGRVHDYLTRYCVFASEYEPVAIALWVAHSHLVERFEVSPILAITSAEMRSGKTRVLDCLELLCPTPERMVTPSPAVAYTLMAERPRPTMMLDEADAVFNKKRQRDDYEDLRAVFNSGNRKGTRVPRVLMDGKKRTVERLDVYGAKAIAGIGSLPDTVADRSILVRMRRKAPDERVARFRRTQAEQEAQAIGRPDWETIELPEVELPEDLNDRAADSWEPLLRIAAAAGGDACDTCDASAGGREERDWSALAILASGALSEEDVTSVSVGVRLLGDIRAIFGEDTFLATTDLLERLYGVDDSPWVDWYGQRLSARRLARLLKPYDIGPVHRRGGRGYAATDFEDAWSRYCFGPDTSVTSVTSVTGVAMATAAGTAIYDVAEDYPASAWETE